jgi:uncharacterized protein
MLFVLLGFDVQNSLPLRAQVRPAHLARVQALMTEGRLRIAGPMPKAEAEGGAEAGIQGSMIVAEFSDLDAARAWLAADPYTLHGVFGSTAVYPFRQVLP